MEQYKNLHAFSALIPRDIKLAEAPCHGMPVNVYDVKSAGAEAYMRLADEIISKAEDTMVTKG